jgi:hypothetical protein
MILYWESLLWEWFGCGLGFETWQRVVSWGWLGLLCLICVFLKRAYVRGSND